MPGSSDVIASRLWRNVDQNAAAATTYLEQVAHMLAGMKLRATDLLQLQPGHHGLELGCGTGRDSEEMARRVMPGGHVVGVDLSAAMVEQATTRTAGLGLPLSFRVADGAALPFAEDSFDGARVERTLQHVPDPLQVARELVRVVRPGGRIVAFEPDWDTMVVGCDPTQQARDVLRALRAHRVDVATAHGTIGRDTPRLFREAGCQTVTVEGVAPALTGLAAADIALNFRGNLAAVVATGAVSEAAAAAWWQGLEAREAQGSFYASILGTIVVAVVPESTST